MSPPTVGVERPNGFVVWYAAVGSIVLWIAHLVSLASLARLSCDEQAVRWVLHVVTLLLAGMTVLAMALALRLVRAGDGADEGAGTPEGRTAFLGRFGLMVGASNLVLILLEGSYVAFIRSCA